ncbi:MAG: DUF3598 family protein [Gloeotrichia echinulata GP01]|jgi:hypothetical protein|nr:DUF3598 family protein [Gloeotrichia echinulata DEX184]
MNAQEQNWLNLFGNHSPAGFAWHGTWTRYSPEIEVINSFKGIRKFWANEDKTIIYHTNNYTYADGSTEEKKWQLDKQTCNQPDGLIHVALPNMRALSFGQGATGGVSKKFEPEKNFGVELFFKHEVWRTSVVIIYGINGDLERISHIREHLDSFPPESPGLEVKEINGQWIGERTSMDSALTISVTEPTPEIVLDPTNGINKTLFLPDGIVINAPERLKISQDFQLIAGRFVTENQFKRLTVKYDEHGDFQLLISEVFYRQS